jgi:rhodanese-related sulfurtransferase
VTNDLISVEELKKIIKHDNQLFLLDVRSEQERNAFHIGGTLIPLHALPHQLDKIDRDKHIVVYCHTGARSMMAVKLLQEAGYTSARSLAGGMMAWQAECEELV